jgi:subtilase family serine protease
MKTFRVSCLDARVLLLVMAAVCPLAVSAQLGVGAVSAMKAPVLAAGSVDLGAVPAAQPMSVVVYLAPDAARQAALEQFLVDVETPGSASYHQWLSAAQFGQRFGASSDSIAAVEAFAAANGLRVGGVSDSGMRVSLTGTATQVESALAPAMHAFQAGGVAF